MTCTVKLDDMQPVGAGLAALMESCSTVTPWLTGGTRTAKAGVLPSVLPTTFAFLRLGII